MTRSVWIVGETEDVEKDVKGDITITETQMEDYGIKWNSCSQGSSNWDDYEFTTLAIRGLYTYLGKVNIDTFKEIVRAFPRIVGVDTIESNGEVLIALGCTKELSEKETEMYKLIVHMWDMDEDTKWTIWSYLE